MFYEDHDPPHFHVYHADFTAKFAIADFSVLFCRGTMTAKDIGRIRTWGRTSQIALLENWFRCQRGEPIRKIEGLK